MMPMLIVIKQSSMKMQRFRIIAIMLPTVLIVGIPIILLIHTFNYKKSQTLLFKELIKFQLVATMVGTTMTTISA